MDGDAVVEDVLGQDAKQLLGVTVDNGVVSSKFGPVAPRAFDGNPRWLEVRVNETTLSRVELVSPPATAARLNRPGLGNGVVFVDPTGNNVAIGADAGFRAALSVYQDQTGEFLYLGRTGLPEENLRVVGFADGLSTGFVFKTKEGLGGPSYAERDSLRLYPNGRVELPTGGLTVRQVQSGEYLRLARDNIPEENLRIVGLADPGDGTDFMFRTRRFIGGGSYVDHNSLVIHTNGYVSVPVLQITGGSDLAEPFNVSSKYGAVDHGMVVTINADLPGQLQVATDAYDRKVAGVISGANDLSPGMVMKSEGDVHADGSHNVALTGRVWAWCDANYGAIEPGDRLTTSCTPGHAMKVTDNERAIGAAIGKAMTPLTEGRGLVLVLVQPQ
jgi:hypothetical protein